MIDSVITDTTKRKNRNLSMAWIDYRKAFDSVPHSWLLSILKIYKVDPRIIQLLGHLMSQWRTQISIKSDTHIQYNTRNIRINRGIFQGDSLSLLWFCLSLNPLSSILNKTSYGYMLTKSPHLLKLTHIFYVDDLKLYAAGERQLTSLVETVAEFSKDIKMQFGVDKCSCIHIQRGKMKESDAMHLLNGSSIASLANGEHYRYLGLSQSHETHSIGIIMQCSDS